jgi:hypothetical protein
MPNLATRYIYAFIVIPLAALVFSLTTIMFIKLALACVRIKGPDQKENSLEAICVQKIELYLAAALVTLQGLGGLTYLYSSFFPFRAAFEDVVTTKHTLNKLLYIVWMVVVFVLSFIWVFFPSASAIVTGLFNSGIFLYTLVIVPLIWRYFVSVERLRNIFLTRMEHSWVCCDKELTIRNLKHLSFIEFGILLTVLVMSVCTWILVTLRRDYTPLVCGPLILIAYGFYRERRKHYFHDFAYVWFIVFQPTIEINLLFSAFGYMFSLWTIRNWQMQYIVLCLSNLYILLMARIVQKAASYVTDDQFTIVALTFPSRFIQMIFQYLIIFSVDILLNAHFWISLAIVFIFNTVDMNLLIYDMYSNLWKRLLNIVRGKQGLGAAELGVVGVDSSFQTDGDENNDTDDESVNQTVLELDILTKFLHILQMKSYTMFLVPLIVVLWFMLDYYIDLNPYDGTAECTYSCQFENQVFKSVFILYRYLAIVGCYIVTILISIITWKLAVRIIIQRYPRIKEVLDNRDLIDNAIERLKEKLPPNPTPEAARKYRIEQEYLKKQIELKRILTVCLKEIKLIF